MTDDGTSASAAARQPLRPQKAILLAVVVLALTGPLLASTWYAFKLKDETLERALTFQMERLADVLANGMREPIWSLTPAFGESLFESVLNAPGVLSARVFSRAQGDFLVSDEGEKAAAAGAKTLTRDVLVEGEKVGYVELTYAGGGASDLIAGFPLSMAFALGVQILISAAIVYLVFRHLVNMERVRVQAAAAAAIREREERLRSVIDNSPSYIVLTDTDGRVQLANKKSKEVFGLDPEALIGRDRASLLPSDREADVRKQEREVIESREAVTKERRVQTGGRTRDVIVTMFPIFDEKGEVHRIGTVATDISSVKKAEMDLLEAKQLAERANLAKSEFLASISHDLRTPLNAIIGFADIIRSEFFGSVQNRYRDYAEDIYHSGKHLLELVDQILDLSAVESGNRSLEFAEVDVHDVVEVCRQTVSLQADEAGVRLDVRVASGDLSLVADRRALLQVLLNLLGNAIKYTDAGGAVTLSVAPEADRVRFTVEDTGCGIHEDDIQRILQPFTRAEADAFVTKDGWGLGLSIAKGLVDLHGGEFELTSQVGEGTAVRFALSKCRASIGEADGDNVSYIKRQA